MVSPSLERVLTRRLSGSGTTQRHDEDWSFVIRKVFQHFSWQQMEFGGHIGGSRGLGQRQLRLSISTLLEEAAHHDI